MSRQSKDSTWDKPKPGTWDKPEPTTPKPVLDSHRSAADKQVIKDEAETQWQKLVEQAKERVIAAAEEAARAAKAMPPAQITPELAKRSVAQRIMEWLKNDGM